MRRLIAEHMAKAQSIPAVTWVEECDFGRVDLSTLLPTVLKAVAESLREFPELNARFEDDAIVQLDRYDLGVAIDTEQGLVVPVVRDCDSRSIEEIDAEVKRPRRCRARGKAAAGGAPRLDVQCHERREVLRRPRHAADQPARGRDPRRAPHRGAPVVRDGEIVARPMGHISVTFDHRALDGKRAAEFGLDVIRRLGRLGSPARPGSPARRR